MKQEVRRGRKFVEYHDPDTQDEFTFTQEISGADVSYQETDGSWNPADESWETDGLDGFSFRAHRMNHKVRFDSIGAWRWYPRRNVETEYIVINRPKCWLTATKRWGNLLVNGISREGRDITLTSVRKVTRVIHSRWNGIKTDWILLDSTAPTKFRQQIDLVGLTELDGWLYGADGEKVALLTPTTAIDADGAELPCSGSYVDGYLQFEADVTGAVYPVVIDPDFAGASGDGTVYADDAVYATAHATADKHISTDLYTGQMLSGGLYYVYRSVLSFDTSSIGTNTISQVNMKLTVHYEQSATDFDVQIVKYNWSGITDRDTLFDGVLAADADDNIFCNTAGKSVNTQYTSGNLSTTWVDKSGVTYYGLRSSLDVAETAPSGNDRFVLYDSSATTESYRPVLTVTYTASGVPKHFLHYARLRSN